MTTTKKILIGIGALGAFVLMFAGWQGVRAYMAWNSIERVEFNLEEARAVLPPLPIPPPEPEPIEVQSPAPTIVAVEYDTVLIVGSDEPPEGAPIDQDGAFADAVMLYMLPDDGSGPLIVSLPRDLVVVDPCTGEESKLDRTLEPCGEQISGEEHVALTVEDFTGVAVDNFAVLRSDAFVEMIDSVGGVTLCVPNALREGATDILPAGCSTAGGASALVWVRSRRTQELVDGEWRFVQETGDAGRVQRQQVLIFALLDELKGIRSPTELASLAEHIGDSIVLDENLSLTDAISMVWDLRSVGSGSIATLTVPTEPVVLDDGSFAVRATVTFATLIQR